MDEKKNLLGYALDIYSSDIEQIFNERDIEQIFNERDIEQIFNEQCNTGYSLETVRLISITTFSNWMLKLNRHVFISSPLDCSTVKTLYIPPPKNCQVLLLEWNTVTMV